MIAYLPSPYPDELIYSALSRWYSKSGYLKYTFAAEKLYMKKTNKPSIEFINRFTPEALELITREIPYAEIIQNHTMIPYYIRFLNRGKRKQAVHKILCQDENYYIALKIPKARKKNIRYLRYCPLCVEADRECYGETYWHRAHQLTGCNICAEHSCQLVSSRIQITSIGSPAFFTAEETIPCKEPAIFSKNELEYQLAQYVVRVFQAELDFETDIEIGDFLQFKMEGTKYLSQRGKQKRFSLLYQDLLKYYGELATGLYEAWKLEKILTSDRINTYDICLIAMFLEIPVAELVHMKLPEQRQYQKFDATVKVLHEQGLNYRQVAEQMQASYDVVKSIGEGNYGRKGGRGR